MKFPTMVGVALSLVGMAVVCLWFVGARTAESGCMAVADQRGYYSGFRQEWSWWPLGTTCAFDNGVSETRLIW